MSLSSLIRADNMCGQGYMMWLTAETKGIGTDILLRVYPGGSQDSSGLFRYVCLFGGIKVTRLVFIYPSHCSDILTSPMRVIYNGQVEEDTI